MNQNALLQLNFSKLFSWEFDCVFGYDFLKQVQDMHRHGNVQFSNDYEHYCCLCFNDLCLLLEFENISLKAQFILEFQQYQGQLFEPTVIKQFRDQPHFVYRSVVDFPPRNRVGLAQFTEIKEAVQKRLEYDAVFHPETFNQLFYVQHQGWFSRSRRYKQPLAEKPAGWNGVTIGSAEVRLTEPPAQVQLSLDKKLTFKVKVFNSATGELKPAAVIIRNGTIELRGYILAYLQQCLFVSGNGEQSFVLSDGRTTVLCVADSALDVQTIASVVVQRL